MYGLEYMARVLSFIACEMNVHIASRSRDGGISRWR